MYNQVYSHRSFHIGHSTSAGLRRPLVVLLLGLLVGFLDLAVAVGPLQATHRVGVSTTAPLESPQSGEPVAHSWEPGPVYMQIGASCVGYSLAAWLDAAPHPIYRHPSGWRLYRAAQEEEGNSTPHDGSTVQAGIWALARLGYTHSWRSTQDQVEALAFLRAWGPIVLEGDFPRELPVLDGGGNLVWTGAMMRHAWLCYGVDAQDRLSCQNSASTYWNSEEGGRFHMTRDALAHVLAHGFAWLIDRQ